MEWQNSAWRGAFGFSPALAALESGCIAAAVMTRVDPVEDRLADLLTPTSLTCISVFSRDEATVLPDAETALSVGLEAATDFVEDGGLVCSKWTAASLTAERLMGLVRVNRGVSVVQMRRPGVGHSFLVLGDVSEVSKGIRMFTVQVDTEGSRIVIEDPFQMAFPAPVSMRLFGTSRFLRAADTQMTRVRPSVLARSLPPSPSVSVRAT